MKQRQRSAPMVEGSCTPTYHAGATPTTGLARHHSHQQQRERPPSRSSAMPPSPPLPPVPKAPGTRLPFEGAWLHGVPDPPEDKPPPPPWPAHQGDVPRRRPGRPNSTSAPPQLPRPPTAPPTPVSSPYSFPLLSLTGGGAAFSLAEVAGVAEAALPGEAPRAERLAVRVPTVAPAAGELTLPSLAGLGAPLEHALVAGVAVAHQRVEPVLARAAALREGRDGLGDLLLLQGELRTGGGAENGENDKPHHH